MTKRSQTAFFSLVLLSTSVGAIALALNAKTSAIMNDQVDFTGHKYGKMQAHGNYKEKVKDGPAARETDHFENAQVVLKGAQSDVRDLVRAAILKRLNNNAEFAAHGGAAADSAGLASAGAVNAGGGTFSVNVNIGGHNVVLPLSYKMEGDKMRVKFATSSSGSDEDMGDEIELDLNGRN